MRTSIALLSAVTLVSGAGSVHGSDAPAPSQASAPAIQYRVSNLPTLGGAAGTGSSINDLNWVTGLSTLAGNQSQHAALWLHGTAFDLGTLGGANSSVLWPVKNDTGLVAGIAQTSTPDPLKENWSCSAFFPAATAVGPTCLGFVWEDGRMQALPTLGGNNGFATGANNLGAVVGWAENSVHDPTCTPPQVLQFRPVVWEPLTRRAHALAVLPGDTSGAATAINDRGQVAGISGTCDQAVGRYTAAHAVLWDNGTVIDIGNLGDNAWNTPMAIDQRGDIAGFAALPGSDPDGPTLHAFLWTRGGGIRDLGTLPGDAISEALGINNLRQVVGLSCNASGACRAFLWQGGVMTDLNTLVAPGYSGVLTDAQDINDRGEITGQASIASTGEVPAFLAVPVLTAP